MRCFSIRLLGALVVACSVGGGGVVIAQAGGDTVQAHRAAAKAAVGQDWAGLYSAICSEASPLANPSSQPAAPRRQGPPPSSEWHVEPAKVFDNLYFVGQSEYSAWAVTTSDGIILIDTIFDYSVEDEVVNGLKKLGLDPSKIKYTIVSHGHGDHSGGAKFLQDRFGTRVLLSAADWDLLDRSSSGGLGQPRPKRDMVVTDGQKLTLGDTTLTMHLTPGHTPGTISTLIPVKDNGRPHVVAEWGGTGFNFTISPDKDRLFWFNSYITSAQRFRDAAMKAGADAMIANHSNFDGTKSKLPLLARRKAGDPNPFVVGTEGVRRYLTVAEECAKAGLITAKTR